MTTDSLREGTAAVPAGELLGLPRSMRAPRRLLRMARRKPLGAVSAVIIAVMVLTAAAAPLLAPYDPTETHPRDKLQGPSTEYRLGTDDVGRDVFSRIVWGARTSLFAGVTATVFGTLLGSLIGMISGYAGGWADMVIQRIMDSLQVLPLIVLLLVYGARIVLLNNVAAFY